MSIVTKLRFDGKEGEKERRDDLRGLAGARRRGDDDDLVLGEGVEELLSIGPNGELPPPLQYLLAPPRQRRPIDLRRRLHRLLRWPWEEGEEEATEQGREE